MGGRWPYSCCSVECCFRDLFNIARSILRYTINVFRATVLMQFTISLMSRVFANGPEDQGSILGRVIPKTQKKKNSTCCRPT